MSGASGKVPAAIHVSPEAVDGGPIARVQDGDLLRVADTPLVLPEWVHRMEAVLRAALGAPERQIATLQSRLAARFNLQ